MKRLFDPDIVADSLGKTQRALRITCSLDSHFARVPINLTRYGTSGEAQLREDAFAMRRFSKAGWLVAKVPHKHLCPNCWKYEKQKRREEMAVEKPVLRLTAVPPREMTRENRRLIFLKLEEVYGSEKTGYANGWTDKRVAEELDYPQGWVALVRDENFGPVSSNPEMDEGIAEAIEEIKKYRSVTEKLLEKAEAIEHRIMDFRKRVGPG